MKTFTRAGLFAGALVLSTLGSASLHSSTESIESKIYLLKVSNAMEAAQLVEAVGGVVTETAASINYLGASLTEDQLELLSRSGLIVRIDEVQAAADSSSIEEIDSYAGGLWYWKRSSRYAGGLWYWKRGGKSA